MSPDGAAPMKPLPLLAASVMAVLFGLFFWPAPASFQVWRFVGLSLAAFVVYLLLLRFSKRLSLFGMNRSMLFLLVAAAVLIRLIVLFGSGDSTCLSGDVYRYIFEGNMVLHGYNPYTTAPEAMAATPLVDTTIFPRILQPAVPTVFPPLSQYIFGLAYLLHSDSIHGFKLISVLFELMTLLSLIVFVRRYVKRHPFKSWALLIYLFSPLVVIEFVMSSHVDILAMPFFVFGLVALRRNRPAVTGVMLAAAAMVKLFGLFFVPVLLFHFMGKDRWRFLGAFLLTGLLLYLPFMIRGGGGVVGSLGDCFTCWEFGGSVFPLLNGLIGGTAARVVSGLLFLAVIGWATLPGRKLVPDVYMRLFIVFGAFVILTPALFPWYLVWLLPFVVYYRNLPFLVLSGTVLLLYVSIGTTTQTFGLAQPWWLLPAVYVPFYALLARAAYRQWRKRRSTPGFTAYSDKWLEELEGQIEEITIRDTRIRRTDGQLVVTPNHELFQNPVVVRTDRDVRRTTIICGVAYGEDVDAAREVIYEAVRRLDSVRDDVRDVQVFAHAFGASSIDFEVTWWTGSKPVDIRASRDQVIASVKRSLDEAGIEIPFPYRTLTFKGPMPSQQACTDRDDG